jgi:hypothetical protein
MTQKRGNLMRINIFLLIVVSLLIFTAQADALVGSRLGTTLPDLKITIVSQKSDPAEPGEVVTLKFKVENNGTATKDPIIIETVPEFPFSNYGRPRIDIGKLRAGTTGSDAVNVEFKLKIDETAAEGDEEIDLRALIDGVWRQFEDFPVKIQTRDVVVSIASIRATPDTIAPGDEFDLDLTVRNDADSLIRDISLKLNLSGDSIPFAPAQSTTEGQAYQLLANRGKVMRFNLVALPNAAGDIYKVPFTLSYKDETGSLYIKQDFISLKVASKPDLLVSVDNYQVLDKVPDELSIRITNRGLTDIKLLTATITETEDIHILSEVEVYVGNIDSDDYETAEYKLEIKTYEPEINIPLRLLYRDATNKQHSEDVVISLRTGNKGIVWVAISTIFKWTFFAGIIALISLAGYWFYKKRKLKK